MGFNQTSKWDVRRLESVLENETHRILLDLEIKTDYLYPDRQPDLLRINKKVEKKRMCTIVDFAFPTDEIIFK